MKLKLNVEDLRKWRKKQVCKYCKKLTGGSVLKCCNTKCKFYSHIPCAINKGLIVPLDYMMEFYDINKDSLEESIPFFCPNHNRDLTRDYKQYESQLRQCLSITGREVKHHDLPGREVEGKLNGYAGHSGYNRNDRSCNSNEKHVSDIGESINRRHLHFDESHIEDNEAYRPILSFPSIAMLDHPEFRYQPGSINNTKNIETLNNHHIEIEKPVIPNTDDSFINPVYSFNPVTEKGFSELNFSVNNTNNIIEGTSNFGKVSKYFYDYFKQDLNRIKKEKRSAVTITEIKELKEFILMMISAYRYFDTDFMKFYNAILKEKK